MNAITINDLKILLANNMSIIGQLNITYKNGKPNFIGYIHKIHEDPLDFTLQHFITPSGKSSLTNIDFPNIDTITINYQRPQNNQITYKVI